MVGMRGYSQMFLHLSPPFSTFLLAPEPGSATALDPYSGVFGVHALAGFSLSTASVYSVLAVWLRSLRSLVGATENSPIPL